MKELLEPNDFACALAVAANKAHDMVELIDYDVRRLEAFNGLGIPDAQVGTDIWDELRQQRTDTLSNFQRLVTMSAITPDDNPFGSVGGMYTPDPYGDFTETIADFNYRPSHNVRDLPVCFTVDSEVARTRLLGPNHHTDPRLDISLDQLIKHSSIPTDMSRNLRVHGLTDVGVDTLRAMAAAGRANVEDLRFVGEKVIKRLSAILGLVDPTLEWKNEPTTQDVVELYPKFADVPARVILKPIWSSQYEKIPTEIKVTDILTTHLAGVSKMLSRRGNLFVALDDVLVAERFAESYFASTQKS